MTTEELIEKIRRTQHLFGSNLRGILREAADRLENGTNDTCVYNSLREFRKGLPSDDSWRDYKRGMDAAIRIIELSMKQKPLVVQKCANCCFAQIQKDSEGNFLLLSCRRTGTEYMEKSALLYGGCTWGEDALMKIHKRRIRREYSSNS